MLLARLLVEVAGKALVVAVEAPDGEGRIGVGRAQLVVELALEFGATD